MQPKIILFENWSWISSDEWWISRQVASSLCYRCEQWMRHLFCTLQTSSHFPHACKGGAVRSAGFLEKLVPRHQITTRHCSICQIKEFRGCYTDGVVTELPKLKHISLLPLCDCMMLKSSLKCVYLWKSITRKRQLEGAFSIEITRYLVSR